MNPAAVDFSKSAIDYASVTAQLPMGVLILDQQQRVCFWNEWLANHSGIAAATAVGQPLAELLPELRSSRFWSALDQVLRYRLPQLLSQALNRYILPLRSHHHSRYGIEYMQQQVRILPLHGSDGHDYALVTVQDVTESAIRAKAMVSMMQRLKEVSLRDPLTNLFNRRMMWNWLDQQMKEAQRYNKQIGCLLIDIDHFKQLNDTHGHQVGDDVLKGFARCVEQQLRDADLFVRYGGEEFVVLLPGSHYIQLGIVAKRVLEAVRESALGGLPAGGVTCSIGASCYRPATPCGADELLRRADKRLYEAKRTGRNRVVLPPEPPS